jgi:hypothetical protein
MNKPSSPLRNRNHVWKWVAPLTIGTLALYVLAGPRSIPPEILLASVSGIFAMAFFAHKSHSDDARFMQELLIHFNTRYDKINNDLAEIFDTPGEIPLKLDEKLVLIDYFNLCAEEWLFRRAGYIWDPVWISWENGMRQYAQYPFIQKLWHEEQKTNSYYGFEFPGMLPETR